MKFGRLFALSAIMLLGLLFLAACTGTPQYSDYYVDVTGSDTTGNGASSSPWRTIQYALNHASYISSKTVRLHLAKGIYQENIVIQTPVVIVGVGSSQSVTIGLIPICLSSKFPSSRGKSSKSSRRANIDAR